MKGDHSTEKEKDLGACPKCGSVDRQSGRLRASELFPVTFETDTVRAVSDTGPVRGIVCSQCKHLELFVA